SAGPCASRWRPRQFASSVRLLCRGHASNVPFDEQPLLRSSDGSPGPRQPPFGVNQQALSTGLWIPLAFRPVAFASGTVLCPLQGWASLTVGLLAVPDCNGVATFHNKEMRRGWVPSILRGHGVRRGGTTASRSWARPLAPLAHYCRLVQPPLRQPVLTEPQ